MNLNQLLNSREISIHTMNVILLERMRASRKLSFGTEIYIFFIRSLTLPSISKDVRETFQELCEIEYSELSINAAQVHIHKIVSLILDNHLINTTTSDRSITNAYNYI